jgi:hypothetical protein
VVIVDAVNGNDSTGVAGDLTKPFLTLLAAQTAASAGQTIVVYPGAYNTAALGKNGVNWYFMQGANITFTSGFGFSVPTTGISFTVRGFGRFTCPDRFLSMSDPSNATGSVVDVECDYIQCQRMFLSVGEARIKSKFTQVTTGISVNSFMDAVIEGTFETSTALVPLFDVSSGGKLRIKNATINNFVISGNCLNVAIISFGDVVLENAILFSDGPSITTTGGPTQSIIAINSVAAQSVGADIEVNGNLQVNYLTPATLGQVPTANADGTWSWA